MNAQNIPEALERAFFPDDSVIVKSGEGSYLIGFSDGTPDSSSHPSVMAGGLVVDLTNGIPYYNSGTFASPAYTSLLAAGYGTLQQVTTAGETSNVAAIAFTGASSAGNALQIGNGTDDILFYTAAGVPTIATDGTSNLAIAPDGGTVVLTGILDCSGAGDFAGNFSVATNKFTVAAASGNTAIAGDCAITGTLTAGTFSIDSITSSAGNDLSLDAASGQAVLVGTSTTGGVTIGNSGGISIADSVTLAASKTLTLTGAAASNILTITAGDTVISDGSITITDADDAAALAITNNTITTGSLVTLSTSSLTTGNGIHITADAVTTGSLIKLQTSDAGMAGEYILCTPDGSATDFSVGEDGRVVITGVAATDMLTITAGDVQITAGDIDVDDGVFAQDTDEDEGSYFKRNYAGAGTAAVLTITDDHASSTNYTVKIDSDGTAGKALHIDHEGTADGVVIDSGATAASAIKVTTEATTGTGLELVCAASTTTSMFTVDGTTGDWIGNTSTGMIGLSADGTFAQTTATMIHVDFNGTTATDHLGCAAIFDSAGATNGGGTSYTVYINASAAGVEALRVDAGECLFDEKITIATGGVTVTAGGITVTAGDVSLADGKLSVADTLTGTDDLVSSTYNLNHATNAAAAIKGAFVQDTTARTSGDVGGLEGICTSLAGDSGGNYASFLVGAHTDGGGSAVHYGLYVPASTNVDYGFGISEDSWVLAGKKINFDGTGGNSFIYENSGVLTASCDGNINLLPAAGANGQVIIGDLTTAGESELHIKGDDDSDNDPGFLVLYDHTGADYFLWVDATGDLRIHTSKPADQGADGVVVGTQS